MRRNGVSMDIRELRTEHIEFSGEIMDRVLRSAILNSNVIDVTNGHLMSLCRNIAVQLWRLRQSLKY